MNMKRTVLSDSLESEFAKRSPNPDWRFRVREITCSKDGCDCELIRIDWFGHGQAGKTFLTQLNDKKVVGEDEPLTKIWDAKEIRRRHVAPFVQSMLDTLAKKRRK